MILLRCGFVCEGVKKGIVKPEESETDEDDLDLGISPNATSEKKKESWRLDGRGKVKRVLLKYLFFVVELRKLLFFLCVSLDEFEEVCGETIPSARRRD
jgi:hypothetical protein